MSVAVTIRQSTPRRQSALPVIDYIATEIDLAGVRARAAARRERTWRTVRRAASFLARFARLVALVVLGVLMISAIVSSRCCQIIARGLGMIVWRIRRW